METQALLKTVVKKITNKSKNILKSQNLKKWNKKLHLLLSKPQKILKEKPNCKVLDPTKSSYKAKPDTINKRTTIRLKLNQLKTTNSVINRFNKLKLTPENRFIKFFIFKFYSFIKP